MRVRLEDIPIAARARERLARLASHLVVDGDSLLIACDEHRSQSRNREGCLERLRALVVAAKVPPKPRIRTKPSKGSIERRIEAKKRKGERKRMRREPD